MSTRSVEVSVLGIDTNVVAVPFGHKRATHLNGYVMVLATNQTYRMNFGQDLTSMSFDVNMLPVSDWLMIRVVYYQV